MLQKAVDELSVLPGGPSYVGMPNLSDAKERFFKEYFTLHNCNARNSFREYVTACQLRLKEKNLLVGVLTLTFSASYKEARLLSRERMVQSSILDVLHEFLDREITGEVFHEEGPAYILLLNLPDNADYKQKLLDFYSRSSEIMKMYFGVRFYLNFSNFCNDYSDLPNRYQEAVRQSFFNPSCPFAQTDAELLPFLQEELKKWPVIRYYLRCSMILTAVNISDNWKKFVKYYQHSRKSVVFS